MLRLFCGTTGTGKSSAMMKAIRKEAELIRDSGDNRKICVVVPDQFTFEYERLLYNAMGCALFNRGNTEVWSFSRLVRDIFSCTGAPEGDPADSTVKTAIMYKVIKQAAAEDALLYYKKQAARPQFTATALTMISELIHSGITPEIMAALAEKAPDNIKEKLTDVSVIYARYASALSDTGLRDPMLDSRIAAENAADNGYFRGMSIYMDEFKSFTGDQYELIRAMLPHCADLTVCLTTDDPADEGFSPFTAVNRTAARLMYLAEKCGVKSVTESFNQCMRYNSAGLSALSNKLMRLPRAKNAASGDAVTVIAAPDIYGECDYICSEIKRLISENKELRYRDIAVLDRSMNEDISILAPCFERYSIPYYSDKKQSAAHKRLMIMINNALELAASKRISTEALFRYAKTGLANPPREYEKDGKKVFIYSLEPNKELLKLENYCYIWDIDGEMWEKPFPDEKMDKIKDELLKPIRTLRSDCLDKTGTEICGAIRRFMASIPAENNLLNFTVSSPDEDEMASGSAMLDEKLEKRENERLLSELDSILSGLERALPEKISLSAFRDIFTLSAAGITLSVPPETLDCVAAQQSDLARLSNPKIVFVMHANDGVFPFVTGESVTFSEREREFFRSCDHDLSGDIKNRIEEERFNAFKALCSPSDRLYVSYSSAASNGSPMYPSALISEICGILENVNKINTDELDMLFFCRTKEAAYAAATEGFDAYNEDFATVRSELSADPVYKGRFEYIDSINTGSGHSISDREVIKKLYKGKADISPSRFEDFSKCPFMFFCKKGLEIYPLQKKDLNPMIRGNAIHKCMQDIFTKFSKEEFIALSEDMILEELKTSVKSYIDSDLEGGFAKSPGFDFYMEIIIRLVVRVILNMQEEMKLSDFVPAACELPLGKAPKEGNAVSKEKFSSADNDKYAELCKKLAENSVKPIEVKTEDGFEVSFSGTADRADIFIDHNDGGKIYLRIIDYKTGAKEFVREQLDLGINMQMFFYLWAITRKDGEKDSIFNPAGAVYAHMKAPKPSEPKKGMKNDPIIIERDAFRQSGEILGTENVLKAMQKNLDQLESDNELYIPAEFDPKKGSVDVGGKKYSNVFTPEELSSDIAKADILLKSFAEAVENGVISASPLENKKQNCSLPCSFCDYSEICGNYSEPKVRDTSLFAEALEKAAEAQNTDISDGDTDNSQSDRNADNE
ncbi:MAG: PD-(D/E)XK nuclease family protein [Oscillospiraceae bacterium]|nr:PD-(D/E)XK nuclease family protein [Oscillospiraceae bacterium]